MMVGCCAIVGVQMVGYDNCGGEMVIVGVIIMGG